MTVEIDGENFCMVLNLILRGAGAVLVADAACVGAVLLFITKKKKDQIKF
jgi:hypothetical protein